MELFKIIKKVFDLTRNEVQQVLKDSKGYSKSLIDAEATRVDTALEGKLNAVVYNPPSDITLETEIVVDDPDFIEWNTLRRVYTNDVVVKVAPDEHFLYFYKDSETSPTVDLKAGGFYKRGGSLLYAGAVQDPSRTGLLVAYNIQFLDGLISLYHAFGGCDKVKYISVTPLESPDSITSVESTFHNCKALIYTDFTLPTSAESYNRVYYHCYNLRHTVVDIDWPNAKTAISAFDGNKMLGVGFVADNTDVAVPKLTPVSEKGIRVNLPVCTDCQYMFQGCERLIYITDFSAPQCVNALNLFYNSGIEKIDRLAVDSATSLDSAFFSCRNLKEITSIEHSTEINVDAFSMFKECTSLEIAPAIPGIISDMYYFFYNCKELTTIPLYHVLSDTKMVYAFYYCEKLTHVEGIDGVSISFGFDHSPLLTRESCLNIFSHLASVHKWLNLHHEAYARLTEEDIAIAVNKGWTVQSV